MAGELDNTLKNVGQSISEAESITSKFNEQLAQSLQLVSGLSTSMQDVCKAAQGAAKEAGNLTLTIGSAGESSEKTKDEASKISDAFAKAVDSVKQVAEGISKAGKEVENSDVILDKFKSNFEKLGTIAKGVAEGIKNTDFFAKAAENLAKLQENLGKLKDAASGVMEGIKGAFEPLGNIASKVFEKVNSGFSTMKVLAGAAVDGIGGAIGPIAQKAGDAVSKVGATMSSIKGVVGNAAGAVGNFFAPLGSLASAAIDKVKGALSAIGPVVSAGISAIGSAASFVGDAVGKAAGMAKDILDDDKITKTDGLNALKTSIDEVEEGFTGLKVAMLDSVAEPLTEISGKALEMMGTLQDAFAEEGFAGLAGSLAGVVAEGLAYIDELLPSFLEAGAGVLESLMQGISENAPAILDSLFSIGESIINTVVGLLPAIAECGGNILNAIKDKMVATIPEMIPAATKMLTDLLSYIIANLGSIIDGGIEILMAIVDGVVNTIPKLAEAAPQIMIQLFNAIVQNLPKIFESGGEIISKILNGIIDSLPVLADGMIELVEVIVNKIKETDFIQLGKDVVNGIIDGIKSMFGNLKNAAADIGGAITSKLKGVLKINSPSKVMREMFKGDFTDGIILGMNDGSAGAEKAAEHMGESVVQGAAKGVKGTAKVGEQIAQTIADGIDNNKETVVKTAEELLQEMASTLKTGQGAKSKYADIAVSTLEMYAADLEGLTEESCNMLKESILQITDEAQKQYDEVLRKQQEMENKLSNFGSLFTYDEDKNMILEDINKNIDALERYDSAISGIQAKGVSDAFLAQITSLSVEEGTYFAEKLAEMEEDQFAAYITTWEDQQKRARAIAEKFYAGEIEEIDKGFAKKLGGVLEPLPGEVETIGIDIMQGLINGMDSKKESVYRLAEEIGERLKSIFREAFDINSPSRWARDVIGKNIVLGIGVGYEDEMPRLKDQMENSLEALSDLKYAVGASDFNYFGSTDLVKENRGVKETQTTIIEKERVVGINFKGRLKDVARTLRPYIDDEDNRIGGSLVMNRGER